MLSRTRVFFVFLFGSGADQTCGCVEQEVCVKTSGVFFFNAMVPATMYLGVLWVSTAEHVALLIFRERDE